VKRKAIAVSVFSILAVLVISTNASRSYAVRVADTSMQKLVPLGWHIESVRFLPVVSGPFWLVAYQHDDYPSCFPFQVTVSFTGKTIHEPTSESLNRVVEAFNNRNGEARNVRTVPE
jgi:hypothetical protein